MKSRKNFISVSRYIVLFVLLYIYIYNPIFKFLGFGSIKILLFFSILYLIIFSKISYLVKLFYKELAFTLVLIVYSLLIYLFRGPAGTEMAYSHAIWFAEGFLIPLFLITYFKEQFAQHDFNKLLISVGFVASCISIFLILNPELNSQIRANVIMDSLDLSETGYWTFRGFTIAESSSFYYGIIQGIMIGFCLYIMKKNYFYIVPIITLFISILFNARTGLMIVIVAFFILIFFKKISFKQISNIAVIVTLIILVIGTLPIIEENSKTIEWAFSFFIETKDFANSSKGDNTYNTLLNDMLFFPENFWDFLFGSGKIVFLEGERTSDVGYVIQIFEGGIFYLSLMLLFLLLMYKRIAFFEKEKFFPLFFTIVILVANVKGTSLFVSGGFFRFFTLYYVYRLTYTNKFISSDKT